MTALTHMAAARPPGIADARVPCPLCGGLIHPIAGKCKHCKEDLTQFRAGRPQAAAPLPALLGQKPVVLVNGSNGHPLATANVAVPAVIPVREGSAPILPPRVTARSMTAQRSPGPSIWKSWPMLVIILAGIAIVAATVIMLLPPDDKKQKQMSVPPGPAPEHMNTDPLPDKQSQIDPWSQPGSPNHIAPPDPDPLQPRRPPPDPDDDDLWSGRPGGTLGGFGSANANFMISVLDKACAKLKSCPDIDQSTLGAVCDSVAMMPKPPAVTNCPAAKRCFEAIDRMSCTQAQNASPLSLYSTFADCTEAATDC